MILSKTFNLFAPAIRNVVQKRTISVIAGPPTKKVSTAEQIFLGGGMCVGLMVYPAWVLYHIREYKGK